MTQRHITEANVVVDPINNANSFRGTYEIARLPEEVLLSFCQVVIAKEAHNLIEARRIVDKLIREQNGRDEKAVTLARDKNTMYRLTSGHNTSSVLLSAQDLIALSERLFEKYSFSSQQLLLACFYLHLAAS